jgi:hypothetical protein
MTRVGDGDARLGSSTTLIAPSGDLKTTLAFAVGMWFILPV